MAELELFFYKGGEVVWVIFFAAVIFWAILIERFIYLYFVLPSKNISKPLSQVQSPEEIHAVKNFLLSKYKLILSQSLPYMKYIVAMLPLLGLLGTVLGMIQIFDTIAVNGTGDVRAISLGISKAIITTLSGLAISIFGILFVKSYEKAVNKTINRLKEQL
jgi:biopolymer transport protein ExbB